MVVLSFLSRFFVSLFGKKSWAMLFCHDPTNFDLSPRFVSKLVEGGSGVGLLQRAQDDVTHRAHQLWLETGQTLTGICWLALQI